MALAMLYPEPERGSGKIDPAKKGAETSSFSYRRVQHPAKCCASRRPRMLFCPGAKSLDSGGLRSAAAVRVETPAAPITTSSVAKPAFSDGLVRQIKQRWVGPHQGSHALDQPSVRSRVARLGQVEAFLAPDPIPKPGVIPN
jgi:hypothetical protein